MVGVLKLKYEACVFQWNFFIYILPDKSKALYCLEIRPKCVRLDLLGRLSFASHSQRDPSHLSMLGYEYKCNMIRLGHDDDNVLVYRGYAVGDIS